MFFGEESTSVSGDTGGGCTLQPNSNSNNTCTPNSSSSTLSTKCLPSMVNATSSLPCELDGPPSCRKAPHQRPGSSFQQPNQCDIDLVAGQAECSQNRASTHCKADCLCNVIPSTSSQPDEALDVDEIYQVISFPIYKWEGLKIYYLK